MVEYVEAQEEIKPKINDDKKRLIVAFYFWNLNLYLLSLLTFSHKFFISLYLYLIILFFVYKYMFGVQRHTRAIITNVLIWIIYLYYFNGFMFHYILLGVTTFINIKFYLIVVKNGKYSKKLSSKF